MGRDSVVGIATTLQAGWSEDRIAMGARFSVFVQPGHYTHLASYIMCTGSFLGVKQPGSGVDHPLPSSAEVKERLEIYLCSSSGPPWPVLGFNLPLCSNDVVGSTGSSSVINAFRIVTYFLTDSFNHSRQVGLPWLCNLGMG